MNCILLYSKVIQLYIYTFFFRFFSITAYCCSVTDMSDSLWPHKLQHTGLPCPPLSPGVCANSCPLSQWCHPTLSSSVVPPFSSRLQSYPASGSFQIESALRIRGPKYWSFNFSISPSSEYSRFISFRIDWFDLLAVHRTFESLFQHHNYTVYYKILNIVPRAIPWRRKWQPTPVFLPEKSYRQGSLVGYSAWTHKESDTTEYICTSVLYSRILLFIYFIFSSVYILMSSS